MQALVLLDQMIAESRLEHARENEDRSLHGEADVLADGRKRREKLGDLGELGPILGEG